MNTFLLLLEMLEKCTNAYDDVFSNTIFIYFALVQISDINNLRLQLARLQADNKQHQATIKEKNLEIEKLSNLKKENSRLSQEVEDLRHLTQDSLKWTTEVQKDVVNSNAAILSKFFYCYPVFYKAELLNCCGI